MIASEPGFYATGGSLPPDCLSYVERQADTDLYEGLRRGEFCYVLTSRQMGKSSLMVHTAARLRKEGIAVAFLDLTAIGQHLTVEQWYDGLLRHLGRFLDLEDELEEFWFAHAAMSPLQRWMAALPEVVLGSSVQACRRAGVQEAGVQACRRAGVQDSTDPSDPSDPERLNARTPERLLQRILYWTGGHPYLTQRLCQAVAQAMQTAERESARGESPPGCLSSSLIPHPSSLSPRTLLVDRLCHELFLSSGAREREDNLLFVRERLLRGDVDRASLLELYAQVRRGWRVLVDDTNELVTILRLAGIVRVQELRSFSLIGEPILRSAAVLRVRNRIYAQVFDREWINAHMPDADLRRQRAAYRRGLGRASALAAIILAAMGGLLYTALDQAQNANEQARENRRQRYVAQMNLAWDALQAHRLDRLDELLGAQRLRPGEEDLRGFEWRYLWRRAHRELASWPVRAPDLQLLSDGRTVVTGSSTNTLQFWNVATGALLASYPVPPSAQVSTARACSPDGRWLATASLQSLPSQPSGAWVWQLRLWDRIANRGFSFHGRQHAILSLAFSPDGRKLVAGLCGRPRRTAPGEVRVWDLVKRSERVFQGPVGAVVSVVFSPHEERLAAGGEDGTIRLWRLSGAPVPVVLRAGRGPVRSVSFSRDGSQCAAIVEPPDAEGTAPGEVKLWNLATGHVTALPAGSSRAMSVAFSPAGPFLAAGGADGTVRLWEPRAKRLLGQIEGHTGPVQDVEFAADGRTLVTSGDDGMVKRWDISAALAPDMVREGRQPVDGVAFSTDGSRLVTYSESGLVRVRDAATLRELYQARVSGTGFTSLSPDGRTVAIGRADGVWIYDIPTRRVTRLPGRRAPVAALAFSGDGRTLAAGRNGGAEVWELPWLRRAEISRREWKVNSLALTPDGRSLAVWAEDGSLRLWDVSTRRETARRRVGHWAHTGASLSPGGRTLAYCGDRSFTLVDLSTQEAADVPADGQRVWSVAFSPDGRTLATGGDSGVVWLWDVATRQEVGVLRPASATGSVDQLSFSADGAVLAAACQDGTVQVWRAAALAPTNGRFPSRDRQ